VVTVPLILLAIPSVYAGWAYLEPMVIGDYFGSSIVIRPEHAALEELRKEWHGVGAFVQHGLLSLPFWLAIAGIVSAWYCYLVNPALPERLKRAAGPIYTLLDQKYYFDRFNDWFFAGGARAVGTFLSNVGDRTIIDGFFVNGAARVVGWTAAFMRYMQSGYVYHYAFTMILGVFALLTWWTR
jgi:NADH-quinone oxidoreductase subunit L